MAARKTDPLGQGDLDSLCGLYALVNAIRWLRHGQEPALSSLDLFAMVVREVDKVADTANVLLDGIDPHQLWPVVRAVLRQLQKQHGIAIDASRPFFRRPRLTAREMAAAIAADSHSNSAAHVVVFWGELNHWTVVHRAMAGHFELFDSCGTRRLRVDQCQMPSEFKAADARPHILDKAGIIRLANRSPTSSLIADSPIG